jgi:hypothetical protein
VVPADVDDGLPTSQSSWSNETMSLGEKPGSPTERALAPSLVEIE